MGRRVRAITPAASGQFVSAHVQVRSYSSPCGTCNGKSGNGTSTGVMISPYPDLLPDVFYLMVRTFRLRLVLLYIHKVY